MAIGSLEASQASRTASTTATAVYARLVAILNTIPSVSGLSITPDPAYAKDTLTCTWTTFTDADGDTDQSTVAWTKGSTPMGTGTTLTGGFVDGDVLTCTVTPDDGEDTGNISQFYEP